jgi:hypothetical protein
LEGASGSGVEFPAAKEEDGEILIRVPYHAALDDDRLGDKERRAIPIERRDVREVIRIEGWGEEGDASPSA